jgi:hypothetical protein
MRPVLAAPSKHTIEYDFKYDGYNGSRKRVGARLMGLAAGEFNNS